MTPSAGWSPRREPLSVLVVDDDPFLRELVSLLLKEIGCEVSVAVSGESALAWLETNAVDVIITDRQMPGMDGADLAAQIRRKPGQNYTYLIMMTAGPGDEAMRSAIAAGVDAFLRKPFERLELRLCVQTAERILHLERRLKRREGRLTAVNRQVRALLRQVRGDMAAAARLQQAVLPPRGRSLGGFAYDWLFHPAGEIGGDLFGVTPHGPDKALFYHLDVTGHGVAAALRSFGLHSDLTRPELAAEASSPAHILRGLNRQLFSEVGGDASATMVCGIIDFTTGDCAIARAGHPWPVWRARNPGSAQFLKEGGPPLGYFAEAEFPVARLKFEIGDRLLIYSDGFAEAAAQDDPGFDEAALLGLVDEGDGRSLDRLVLAAEDKVRRAMRRSLAADDISLLVLERTSRAGDVT